VDKTGRDKFDGGRFGRPSRGALSVKNAAPPVRRPRNRRQLIIAAATEQFRRLGYHNVGITDISGAVGITSAALYRHFSGKQDLLEATLQDAVDKLPPALALGEGQHTLDDQLRAACAVTIHGSGVGVLWTRELLHLPHEVQQSLRRQVVEAVEPVRRAIATARPELAPDEVDLLHWATMGVLASDGYFGNRIHPKQVQERLLDVCRAVTRIALPALSESSIIRAGAGRPSLLPASRQEAILTAASRQFGASGYQAVGMDDIGAEVGITGATIYYHFENKAAILAAALNRCVEAMFFDLSGALDASDTPGAALDKVLRCFVGTCVGHGPVVGALQKEAINLPDEQRNSLLQKERDYLAEWAALLSGHRENLSLVEAQVIVRTAATSITGLIDIPQIVNRPNLPGELVAVGRAILGLAEPA
jgi:AcrR family transcriptional regulator